MPFSGDLASIDLADLLQNIEAHSRTGILALEGEAGASRIFVREGKVAMFAADTRPPLADMLVAAGVVSAKKMEAIQKRLRGSRKSLADALVAAKAISAKALQEAAQDFLAEDVSNLIASADGGFHFSAGDEVPEGFDPDEQQLALSLPISPLVLEATRRADHWVMIRKLIPSDTIHFVARDTAKCPDDAADAEVGAAMLEALDGTLSVAEAVDLFPSRRFLAYRVLSDFVRDRLVRSAEADDLVKIAQSMAAHNPQRARRIVERGLEAEPHHLGLLTLEADLAERLEAPAAAAAALKMLAHLSLEAGQIDAGKEQLEKAKLLTPADTALWERTLSLAIQQGRRQDALHEGMRLVDLYRAPGLHLKAKEVIDRLLKVDPGSVELSLELARTLVDTGDPASAVRGLLRSAKALVARESYTTARLCYEQVLVIEAGNREATIAIDMIDKDTYARRRERKRRAARFALTASVVVLTSVFLFLEACARIDLVETTSHIDQERLIEQGQYASAIWLLEEVGRRHPFTATALFDVRRRLDDLQARVPQPGGAAAAAVPGAASDRASAPAK